jgi:hypothetical protein
VICVFNSRKKKTKGGKKMKHLICLILCFGTLIGNPVNASANNAVSPRLDNGASVNTAFSVSSNGVAQIILKYNGNEQNTAGGKITTQLQKRFLLVFWTDVDGGYWVDESGESSYTAVHTLAVQTGTYRVKVEYLIYGTDGSVETVNDEAEYTYN